MEYDNLYSSFKALFPDNSGMFSELEKESLVDETDGIHVAFAFVVVPFIVELIKANDEEKLQLVFDYLEKMETSENPKIAEVVEFTVIEGFISNYPEIIPSLQKYMRTETIECFEKLIGYFGKQTEF